MGRERGHEAEVDDASPDQDVARFQARMSRSSVAVPVPKWITGDHAGVAARVSAHPVVVALCEAFGAPITSTSANPAGVAPAYSRDRLDSGLLADIDGIVAGETGGGSAPSTIRDARTGQVLRA